MDLTQQPQLLALVEGPGGCPADVLAVLVVPLDLGSVGLLWKSGVVRCEMCGDYSNVIVAGEEIITVHRPL